MAVIASRPVRHHTALSAYNQAFAAFARWGWDARKAATVMAAIDYLARALDGTRDADVDDLGFELAMRALIAFLEVETVSAQG